MLRTWRIFRESDPARDDTASRNRLTCAYIRYSRHGQIVGSAFARIAKYVGLDLVPANRVTEQPDLLMVWLPKLTVRGGWLTARAERDIDRFLKRYPETRAINRSFCRQRQNPSSRRHLPNLSDTR